MVSAFFDFDDLEAVAPAESTWEAVASQDCTLDSQKYSAPPMTEEEQKQLTVPLGSVNGRLRSTLEEHGVAIITDVVSAGELAELEADFAEDLRELVDVEALQSAPEAVRRAYQQFLQKGPSAFPLLTTSQLTASAGFTVLRCLSHGRFAWRIRRHPSVHAVFRAVYPDAERLVTSLDVTFFSPEGHQPVESNSFSAHVDQNRHDVRRGLASCESYQSVLYAWPSEADGQSSTTVVWPGSHQDVWPEMMRDPGFYARGVFGIHYSEINEMTDRSAARTLAAGWARQARRAVVPRGALLLWNSRTVHASWKGGPRLAQAVCLEPSSRRDEAQRIAKLRLSALGLPSTHWASVGMQHDIVLGSPGCIAKLGTEASDCGSAGVILPLRPAIWPAALAEDADLDALASLVLVKYQFTGMWEPTPGAAQLLEASIRDEFKCYL
eukprot:CAMPEP_0179040498 /NCGR_PEP_ID=MMETSP0796-20121207/15678_1 /TAXON_ID=73915 /ORGANISM="Pyrodinium bahamense, Strain pbaha01" /LENGTH=437 /DNA_ID=CAMNT_0020736845 /DNA_START=72 /DNA_END=1385 /DNA_ORIENTATION=+